MTINNRLSFFKTYKVNEIFTPNTVPKYNYVKREKLEKEIRKHLDTPGKQIVVFGHSGSGKSTLITKELKKKKRITFRCSKDTTFENIINGAYDQLNQYYISSKTKSLSSSFSVSHSGASSSLEASNTDQLSRVINPQLNPQNLAKILSKKKLTWIIEDFHKVDVNEKQKIADTLKIFIDESNDYPDTRIVCIGAVDTSRQLFELDTNLNNRVADINVRLLSDDEIMQIIENGFKFLNVSISDETKQKIKEYSNNIGSVAHQICLNLCHTNNIKEKKIIRKKITDTSIDEAINSYVTENAGRYNDIFEKIQSEKKYGKQLLRILQSAKSEGIPIESIHKRIDKNNKPHVENLQQYMNLLCSSEFEEVLRYNSNTKKYILSNPFFIAYIKMKYKLGKKKVHKRSEYDSELFKELLTEMFEQQKLIQERIINNNK